MYVREVLTAMKQRHIVFCEAYLVSGNATDAAIKAGYSPKTARSQGHRLLTNADIKKYIEDRNEELKDANTADIEEVRQFWTSTMRDGDLLRRDRLKASELLGKSLGAFETEPESSASDIVEAWIVSIPEYEGEKGDE